MGRWTDLADWQGESPNEGGAMGKIRMLVVHVEQGSNAGSISWCLNPTSKVSAHFFNPKSGRLVQLVDTDRVAWAEVDYNTVAISCENEGYSGESLTANQVENLAQLLARAHSAYGVPLTAINDPGSSGVIGHGLLGAAGGGHYDCPGDPILGQRTQIIARATQILNPSTDGDDFMSDNPLSPAIPGKFPDVPTMVSDFPANQMVPAWLNAQWANARSAAAADRSLRALNAVVEVKAELDALSAKIDRLVAKLGA